MLKILSKSKHSKLYIALRIWNWRYYHQLYLKKYILTVNVFFASCGIGIVAPL